MNKRKVIIICRRYMPGEAWTNRMLCYAKGLYKLGYSVDVVFLIADKERHSYSLPLEGVKVTNLWEKDGWFARHSRILSYLINKKKFAKYIQGADICLMFDAGGFFIDQVPPKFKGKVIVEITEHPEIWHYPFGVRSKAIKKRINDTKAADLVLVISNALKVYFVKHGVNSNSIKVVNIFVDGERFADISKHSKEKTVVYCGTVSRQKDGVDILLQAFAEFHQKHSDYSLLLYGKGETANTIPELSDLANRLGINNYVFFYGYTPYNEMPQKLKDASILALSRPVNKQNDYGFPTKLGEYLATSNPVVVTSVGEIPMFIKDGYNGFLVEPGDAKSFAEKLVFVADHYDEASIVGHRGYELTQKEFSYETQIIDIIASIK